MLGVDLTKTGLPCRSEVAGTVERAAVRRKQQVVLADIHPCVETVAMRLPQEALWSLGEDCECS